MSPIRFDEHGFLSPYKEIDVSPEMVAAHFVEQFPESQSRPWLYANYSWYIETFRAEIFSYFDQWLNGSFVTQKLNPADIDMVTFLDYRVLEAKEELLDNFLSFSLETKGLDAYIVPIYPVGHRHHPISENFKNQWFSRFTTTKANNLDRIYQKGFLKISF